MLSHNNPISKHLRHFRVSALLADGRHLFWIVYCSFISILGILIVTEKLFYFSVKTRSGIWLTGDILLNSGLLVMIYGILMVAFNRIKRYRWSTLAKKVGTLAFDQPDSVLNALQLERAMTDSASRELSGQYIRDVDQALRAVDRKKIFISQTIKAWKSRTLFALLGVSLIILFSWNDSHAAVHRLTHPDTDFPVPTPFTLASLSGDIHLLGGDPATISIHAEGDQPDTVYLSLKTTDQKYKLYRSASENNVYTFNLTEIFSDFDYQAFVPATHFWQPWDSIKTNNYHILVTDRPTYEDFSITVLSPPYSKLDPKIYSGNTANIQGLLGSTIALQFKSNRKIQSGYILLDNQNLPLSIAGQYGSVQFPLEQDGKFTVHFADDRGITNHDPIPYRLQVLADAPPNMTILSPEMQFDLGSDQAIPIQLDIEDDFGFSNLQVGYEVRRPSYLDQEPYISIFSIHIRDPYLLSQEIGSYWVLDNLELMPEDEVHFHFELYDNDIISGPKKFVSSTFIARVPSLADLFAQMEEEQTDITDQAEVNLDELSQIQDQLESTRLDLLKSENIDWEQRQEIEQLLEKTDSEIEKLQELSTNLAQLKDFGEKHGLLNEDLQKKFQELQRLVQDVISEDLLLNMEDVEKALDSMNMEDLQSAMEDLAANLDQMEENLDRYLDIFKRIQAEQKLAEVVNRLSQLEEQQDLIDKRINETDQKTDKSTFARLEQEENWNLNELEKIQDVMKEAAEAVQEFSPETAESLEELEASPLTDQTRADLENTVDQLDNQNSRQAKQSSKLSLEDLQALMEQAKQVQQQFQQETGNEMAKKFQEILRDLLAVSKAQEDLNETTAATSRNSPRMKQLANRQQQLQDQLSQIMSSMMDLSRETFAITPEMGQMMGKSFVHMEKSIGELTERNSRQASQDQQAAMESINQSALALYQAAQNMQSGQSSASGYEQFLQQMEALSKQQQGINQQGMQMALGQMSAGMQQSLMQRLMSEQQQVRKSLQQLMNEMTGSSKGQKGLGDLSGIAKDMDDVIKDLQRKRFTRKTQERQQRILSRMLDSQKSLTQRGEKEDRKSTSAPNYLPYSGPGGLPADMGQRKSLTMEALNQALKAGYSSDYQDMIRRYFNTLTAESDQDNPVTEEGENE